MLSILDRGTRLCDGITRRELLRIGGLSTLGLSLPSLLAAKESGLKSNDPTFGRAKNVIYVWLQGGPPQHETFDPKPNAPLEIRGPFKPINTNVPGIDFCELLPRTARIADKLCVIRSLSTDNNLHDASGYELLTGYKYRGIDSRMIAPTDWPWFGSIVKMLRPSEIAPALSTVWIPEIMRLNENVTPAGQTGGFLGRQWDPDRFTGDPSKPDYEVEGLRQTDVTTVRLQRRASLLKQVEDRFRSLERGRPVGMYDGYQGQALDLLVTGRVRDAFAVQKEPDAIRDRYGRTQWGQSLLLSRRLIEAGARLVHVNWAREPGDSAVDNPMWDTHAQNADRVEDVLCPMFDVGFTALIEDLDQRGLLDETLVVAIGEFGRTPHINREGGRDHWGPVFSFALAGAGIQTAQVYGASDKDGGYPAKDRVSGGDLTATIFHLLGIHHETRFHDPEGREHRITLGTPIAGVLGSGAATSSRCDAGGSIARVPPYNEALLLNTDFSSDLPLYPTTQGSRPKGWRAAPLLSAGATETGVCILKPGDPFAVDRPTAAIGFGRGGDASGVAADARAILAQEMRNPRLGRFDLTVDVCGHASSREFYEDVFLKNFHCRLIIYRYSDATKDPGRRSEFISLPFQAPFAAVGEPRYESFSVGKLLDSPGPGQNFPIGNGYGVAVAVERSVPGELSFDAPSFAFVRVGNVRLDFRSRTINDDVRV